MEALIEGESMSGSWFLPDDNMSYAEAVAKGELDTWLPTIDDPKEEKEIIKQLKALKAKITERNMRLYKKHEIMKVPE